jgi:hypothetical protein
MAAKKGAAIFIALTGAAGLEGDIADHIPKVRSNSTAYIKEAHLMIYHVWCLRIDAACSDARQEERTLE